MREIERICVVIDTNVIVSSLFSLDGQSYPAVVVGAVFSGVITPLFNQEILEEYREVLSREKFPFSKSQIDQIITVFRDYGIDVSRTVVTHEPFPDPDDAVFYEVTMSVDEAFLVTGNIRHFPKKPFVVTPSEMVAILVERGLLKYEP